MKKNLLLLFFSGIALSGFTQVTIESGANIVVSAGSSLVANNGITSNNGVIDNDGTIANHGHLVNNTSGLFTATSTGTIKFNGSTAQEITGDHDAAFYGDVEIDNIAGVSITNTSTGASQSINGSLVFTNGLFTLNSFNLTLLADATTPGIGKYVQTNGTGGVTRNVPSDATDIFFPVGYSAYNPVILQNSATATADDYSVRVVDAEPAGSSSDHFVNRSWEITELLVGGSDLTVTPQWNGSEELTGFDRTNSAVGLTTNSGVDYIWSATSAASGTNPYSVSGSPFTGVGTFTVGDYFFSGKRLNLTVFLGGAYNGSTMDNDLYTTGVLLTQTTDPYSLGTTVSSIPANAIDWVKVELRDNTNHSAIQYSYAFFVDANGNLLDPDGSSGGKITGALLQNYYIAIVHRNHFGIVSSSVVNLNTTSPTYDFTSAQTQAWQDGAIATNAAMKNVSGVFCLWEGDANGDGEVQYEGGNPDRITVLNAVGVSTPTNEIAPTYSSIDVNMDGKIQYEGGNPDRVSILNVVGVSTPTVAFAEHLPN